MESSIIPSTELSGPLISPANEIKVGGNFCTRIDENQVELITFYKILIIFLGAFLIISGFINIILTLLIKTKGIFVVVIIDIAFIIYGFIVSLSIYRIKWLRVIATVLSVIYFIGGIIAVFVQNIILDDKINEDDKKKAYINICNIILFGRIIWFIFNLNALFYFYWGIRCCCWRENREWGHHSHHHGHHHSPAHSSGTHHGGHRRH